MNKPFLFAIAAIIALPGCSGGTGASSDPSIEEIGHSSSMAAPYAGAYQLCDIYRDTEPYGFTVSEEWVKQIMPGSDGIYHGTKGITCELTDGNIFVSVIIRTPAGEDFSLDPYFLIVSPEGRLIEALPHSMTSFAGDTNVCHPVFVRADNRMFLRCHGGTRQQTFLVSYDLTNKAQLDRTVDRSDEAFCTQHDCLKRID